MTSIFEKRSLAASLLLTGAVLLQTACAGSDRDQSELAAEVTQTEPAEAPTASSAPEAQAETTTGATALVPETAPSKEGATGGATGGATAVAEPAAAPGEGQPRVVRYVSVKEAVLRAAPSDSAAKVGVLPKGERVMVVEENGWGRVSDEMFVKLNALSPKAVPRKREKATWSKPAH